MESNIEKPKPEYMNGGSLWQEKITEEIKKRHWNMMDLLRDKESEKIENELLFKDISESEKTLYAETASRLAFGLMNYNSFTTINDSIYEIRRLSDEISGNLNDELFLHMITWCIARERDSNSHGNSNRTFSSIVEHAAEKNLKGSQKEIHEKLVNPFSLEDGTKIFRFNKDTNEIESFKIEVLIDKGNGLVVYGEGENGQEDLNDFNRKLSYGIYMKEDGSNYFGGVDLIREKMKMNKLYDGAILKIDTSFFIGVGKFEEMTVIRTNIDELENKYGNAYLGFLRLFPRGKGLVKLDLKTKDDRIIKDIDFNTLNIID